MGDGPFNVLCRQGLHNPGGIHAALDCKDLSGEPVHTAFVTGIDSTYAASPVPGVVPDDYSDRYTFYYRPEKESYLYLSAGGDDGYRLLIDGETVIDDWENKAFRSKDIIRRFEAGKVYRFTYEHTDDWAVSQVLFRYSDQMNDPAFAKALDEGRRRDSMRRIRLCHRARRRRQDILLA